MSGSAFIGGKIRELFGILLVEELAHPIGMVAPELTPAVSWVSNRKKPQVAQLL